MNIVVTGGLGFIGSNFIRRILSKGLHSIVNIDKMTYAASLKTKRELDVLPNYTFVRADICDGCTARDVIRSGDIVVNFAAESHVDRSIKDDLPFLHTNVLGTAFMLAAAREKKASLFVQISTDEVYGSLEFHHKSSTEKHSLCPSSPYSASKAAAEMLCFSTMHTFKQPVIITRSSNNFGPYQFPEKLIPLFIAKLSRGEQVPVYGNGKNIRDWIYVDDNCDAISFVIEKGQEGQVYNIGGGNEVSNMDLTKLLLKKMGKDESSIKFVEDRLGHDLRYSLDCTKLHELGWKPKSGFDTSLDATIEWYLSHNEWWGNLLKD